MEQIITSILDNDLYSFSQQYFITQKFPRAKSEFRYVNRGGTKFPEGFADELKRQVKMMESVGLTFEEKLWLHKKCGYYLPPTYIDFLSGFRYNSNEVHIDQKGTELEIVINTDYYRAELWEPTLLALISELYSKMIGSKVKPLSKIREITALKAKALRDNGVNNSEFGTRRRRSFEVQQAVVQTMKEFGGEQFKGTSNVRLAFENDITPIGTMSHQSIQFHAAKYGFISANEQMMGNWQDVYFGSLGIYLPDTFGSENCLLSFGTKYAKLYDGVRQDSGDPYWFTELFVNHYERLQINSRHKAIVYSNALNVDKAIEINNHAKDYCLPGVGIGTEMSNDVEFLINPQPEDLALNQVIKMFRAKPYNQEWTNTIKLSDDFGKVTGDPETVKLCKTILNIQ